MRHLLAMLAGRLVSAAVELAASLGTAAPLVVEQTTMRIAKAVRTVVELLRRLARALDEAAPAPAPD